MAAGKHIYSAVARSALSHGAAVWYTPAGLKGARKGITSKIRSIQGKALRVAIGAYKATATEVLKVETNTAPIDLHLDKLVQRSIVNIDARESGKVIEAAIKRIRKDIEGKRGRRSKLRPTPL